MATISVDAIRKYNASKSAADNRQKSVDAVNTLRRSIAEEKRICEQLGVKYIPSIA